MKKNKKNQKSSVQELLGVRTFTPYGIQTQQGEFLLFEIAPTNISVLPKEVVADKIRRLTIVLSAIPELEICCLDAAECFDDNLAYLRERIEEEPNAKVSEFLKQDRDALEDMQLEMASARQFLLLMRCRDTKQEQVFSKLNDIQRIVNEQGFSMRHLQKADIKRMLGLYFGTARDADQIADVDGELYIRDNIFKRKREKTEAEKELVRTKNFFDCISPGVIKFFADHYIVGDSYRCVWSVRTYPPSTNELAILSNLSDKGRVMLHIYNRRVDDLEWRKITQNAIRRNKLKAGENDVNAVIEGESNLKDITEMLTDLRQNQESLLHSCVFVELRASSLEELKKMQSDIALRLVREKLSVDQLTLRQKDGFLSVMPLGVNHFGAEFERVLPASSVANFFPFGFSGKTDPHGFHIGRDKFGSHVVVDFDQRSSDKTNSNILILGNSGEGKSYLMKLLLMNIRENGKKIICLDAESEYEELTNAMGGCYVDLTTGKHIINPLEPRGWTDRAERNEDVPESFRKMTRLSQHIAYLKDFFRSYKDFTDSQIATIEIMLTQLYRQFGITDEAILNGLSPDDYPTMADLYALCEETFDAYDDSSKHLYSEETLQDVCLGLHSMCIGSESKYFNGHTNITDDDFLCFGVQGLLDTNERLRSTMLFNILSYMSGKLLNEGNTVAAIDELYLFLGNLTSIEYIRNIMKRNRKRGSGLIIASQNINDFFLPQIEEYTKPLFAIPTHQFLFHPGNIDRRKFMETLQLENAEYELISRPQRGVCLNRCGNERYLLQVIAFDHKKDLLISERDRSSAEVRNR